jgi:Ca2+-binding EF-hand superfamily protein
MRELVVMATVTGLLASMASAAPAQVERDKLKREAERKPHSRGKADSKLEQEERVEDDDDSNVGAIVGGVAAVAIVGKLVSKKGGDDDKSAAPAAEQAVDFGSMDRDRDGALARDEFMSAMSAGFRSADKNGDGTLTRAEATATFGERGGRYFDALDSAGTGSISMAALEKDAQHAFAWADADGDGSISAAEKNAAATEHHEEERRQGLDPARKAKLKRKIR